VIFSVAAVSGVALLDSPELRWYAAQTGWLPRWLADLFALSPSVNPPFPSLSAPPAYSFLLLTSFTVLLLTVSLMAESITTFLLRLYRRLEAATNALSVAEDLSFEVLRASPSPAALVYADTLRIAQASQSFQEHFFADPEDLASRTLFDLVHFAFPDVIMGLMADSGGEISPALYSVEGETKIGRVRVEPIRFGGRSYIYINIQDISEQQYLQAAANALETPVVVISGSKRVLCFNRAAVALFEGLTYGIEASAALHRGTLPAGWWAIGLRTRLERRLELDGKRWVATCTASRLPGEKDALVVLSLRSAEGGQ
jgi:hypothetical protein